MQVLMTGGAGFIGSHLAELLISRGHDVCALDDLSTGSISNLGAIRNHPRFRFQSADVMDRCPLAEFVDNCDVIYHLAAAVGVRLVVESPVRTIQTNVGATEVVLDLASKKKKLVLVASTSEVYGKSTKTPFCEGDDLVIGASTHGRWSYACSKAIDEFLALAYWRGKKLTFVFLFPFKPRGAGRNEPFGLGLSEFCNSFLPRMPPSRFLHC